MARIALSLVGPPSVRMEAAAAVPALQGAKTIALLAYLALEPGPHTREELAALLWGEVPDAAARASLRQSVHHLHLALGDGLRLGRRTVELVAGFDCDVLDFLRTVDDDPRAAVALDASRFLAGFTPRHAPAFEEWVEARRSDLRWRYEQALARLAREALAARRWGEAGEWIERWRACDPLSEEAMRLRVEASWLGGDRAGALARFAEFRERLRREVGCQPGKALLALVQRVEQDAGRGGSNWQVTGEWPAHAPAFEAVMIGREAEWARLTDAWRAVRAREEGRVVLIEGEPGVGKSRLAAEFQRWVAAEGGMALRGRAYDARGGVPYGPLVEALRAALDAPGLAGTAPEWLAEVARLLPELRQRFPSLGVATPATAAAVLVGPVPGAAAPGGGHDAHDAWRLFEGVAQVLLSLAAERPVLVTIEDLQWCDGDSCALLHLLVRRTEHAPVLWLGTLTTGELEREAPVTRLARALRARAGALALALGPLGPDEVWRLVREMGHVSTPTGARRFANRIHEITGGNPFYIVELLKTLFAQGLLAVDEGSQEWTVAPATLDTGALDVPMPRSVHDAIADRIERLPDELRDVLITIALAGMGCWTDLLSHVHGISRLHAAALGDALVERRLVVEEQDAYRSAHPVVGRVARASITASRQREVHRALALALERVLPPEPPGELAGELARHAERGGERALAYRYALLAGEAALSRFAHDEALGWLDLAAAVAQPGAEADEVGRRTADVLEAAGWHEAPARPRGPAEREAEREMEEADFDLRVRR